MFSLLPSHKILQFLLCCCVYSQRSQRLRRNSVRTWMDSSGSLTVKNLIGLSCMSTCQTASHLLSVRPPIRLSIHSTTHLSLHLSIHPSTHPVVHQQTHASVHPSINTSTHLSICLSFHSSIHISYNLSLPFIYYPFIPPIRTTICHATRCPDNSLSI